MTILEELAEYARMRVEEAKKQTSLEEIKEKALKMPAGSFSFEHALKKEGIAFILSLIHI